MNKAELIVQGVLLELHYVVSEETFNRLVELVNNQLNAQQTLAPDMAYWLCKECGAHQYKDFDTCGDCGTPRG